MKLFKTICTKLWFSIKWIYAQIRGADARRYIKIAMVMAKMTPTKLDDKALKTLLSILKYVDATYGDLAITYADMASNITEDESVFRGFTADYNPVDNVFKIGNDLISVSYDPETGKINPSLKIKF